MGYFKKKILKISDFEIKRQEIWRNLSRIFDQTGKINNKQKYKTKESAINYLCNKFNLSRSQIKRLINKFNKTNNEEALINFIKHQNSFKTPYNKTSNEIINSILNNFSKYHNYAITRDKLGNEVVIPYTLKDYYYTYNHNISYNCLRNILIKNNIAWSFAYRSTKKKIKFNLSNNSQKEQSFLKMVNQALNYKLSQHNKQIKKQHLFGEIAEIDGCMHLWIPELGKCNILAIIDASTGMMLSASLDWQETNNSYAEAIFSMVNNYGLPERLYGDKRRSIFSDGINQTKITKPLTDLGVIVRCESFPEHKPNVEACWKLLQQSLPILLHRRNIKTYQAFKEFVDHELCTWFNKRFNRKQNTLSVFKKIESEVFKNYFCVAQSRKVKVGNYIEINNNYYAPFNTENQRIAMKENGYINVYENLNPNHRNGLFVKRGTEKLYLKPIDILTETIDWNLIDVGSALSDEDELITNLKNEVYSLKDEINRLKIICKESGINY